MEYLKKDSDIKPMLEKEPHYYYETYNEETVPNPL